MWLPSHSDLPYDAIIVLFTSYTQFLKADRKSEIDFQNNINENYIILLKYLMEI